jgi:hypothetical protein
VRSPLEYIENIVRDETAAHSQNMAVTIAALMAAEEPG